MIRETLFNVLEIENPDNRISNRFERFMFIIIVTNLIVMILETVKDINLVLGTYFYWFDMFSLAVFTGEYVTRLWVCTLDKRYSSFIMGRLRYSLTPMMIIDLIVIIPLFLPIFFTDPFDTRFLLILRTVRIARLLKLTRYSRSFQRLARVSLKKKDDLMAAVGVVIMLLVVSSSMMYYVEHNVQPEKFSSIPAAMWWSVATLTTVGYGDVFPVTNLGKFIGAFIAILGIGMVALPTGIIGSGFLEEMQTEKSCTNVCPHCGKQIDELN